MFKRPAKGFCAPLLMLFAVTSVLPVAAAAGEANGGPAGKVNPFIGTGKGPGDSENLFPGAVVPFGMVQLSPDTEDKGLGYHYYQDSLKGFSMTHMSGVGCANEGEVSVTATTGAVVTDKAGLESPYSHDQESASPGYYQVRLKRWDVNAELTATERTGMLRFTFPAGKTANIVVPISHTLNNTSSAEIHMTGDREMEGYVENQVFCDAKGTYKVYFVIRFDHSFAESGTWNGTLKGGAASPNPEVKAVKQTNHEQWVGAYASWPSAAQAQTVTAQIGISYVDLEGARNNLKSEAEGKSFDQIHSSAVASWNKALSVIEATGGSETQQRVFYTGLYHSLLMPSILSDVDGRYIGFDDAIHNVKPGHELYGNFSGWDIYRDQMPLVAMIDPKRMEDMADSVALMYKQGGWIDRWPQINRYTNIMAGSPLTVIVSTAWLDGLHDFDMKTAWEGMYRDATEPAPAGKPYQGQIGIDWINKLHYAPNDKVEYGSVSQIQEDVIAYASLYRLGKALGKTAEAKTMYDRSLYYRNVFDPETRFFRPRNADGSWVPIFDPAEEWHGFIEGSGWHYQWFEPTDMAWVVKSMGQDLFNKRLTNFFDYEYPSWFGQYYNPYNETDLQAPFEFNFSGKPWETQRVVRRVLKENYPDTPDGIPGNDDCGAMSSWAVMSMMGFYSVDPTSLAYELTSPVFPKVVIHLNAPYKGRTFTIESSPDPEHLPYIQSVELNGKAHAKNWIRFQDMTDGGAIRFTLGAEPNKSWGAQPQDAPPSLSEEKP
ncbi:GH92 family glycosyl hydrolase [Silvibacterium acidisoli]|uniref:GH92 family glycosyl hydrolase n=1 Tax=Acidobacteriaceae bacterium ZG23-2 TaxID=2883246 RepID=UPI00406CE11F